MPDITNHHAIYLLPKEEEPQQSRIILIPVFMYFSPETINRLPRGTALYSRELQGRRLAGMIENHIRANNE